MMITRATPQYGKLPVSGSYRLGVRDIFRVVFRHKRKMALFFVGVMALAIGGLAVYPRTYTSEARLMVRLGKESVGLDPTASLGKTTNISDSRENEINSEMEILRSRILLEQVVEQLGADEILADPAPVQSEASENNSWLAGAKKGVKNAIKVPLGAVSSWLSGDVGPNEQAISKLEKQIGIVSPKRSSVFLIKVSEKSPEKAQRILQAFLNAYQTHHSEVNRTPGSFDFFVDQSELLRKQLEDATAEVRDFKNATHLVSVEGQRGNVQKQTDAIETAYLDNQRHLSAAEAKISALRHALEELPNKLVAEETETPNVGADLLRTELYKVEILEHEASSRLTPQHPHVIALRKQVAENRKVMDQQTSHRNLTTKRLSPVYMSVQTDLWAAEALAASLRAEGKRINEQYQMVQGKVRSTNDNEVHLLELTRKADLLETSYKSYTSNREQARIDLALSSGEISNVRVVQPATLVAKPSNPRAGMVLALGFLLAAGGALVLAFVAEYLDGSLQTAEQVEQELEIPVLLAVPRGARHELLQN